MDQHTGPIRVIRAVDPALDVEKVTDIIKYRETRDRTLIPTILQAGAKPTYYTIVKPTRRGIRYIRSAALEDDVNERAFAVCVSKVERPGTDYVNPSAKLGVQPCTDEWLDNFAEAEIQEIGMVAWTNAFLAPDQPRFFAQLPMLVSGLTALLLRHAELKDLSSDSDPSSDAPPE